MTRRLQWMGVALGAAWWPLEAAIHAWLLGRGDFFG